MQFQITEIGTPPFAFAKIIELKFIGLKKAMNYLGKFTRDHMREVIDTQKHRKSGSMGRLEQAINYYIEPIPNQYTVGIGSVEELNHFAPYWYLINYGGMSTVAARGETLWGSFDGINPPMSQFKGSGKGHGYFYKGVPALDGNIYPMKPTSPVWAMNYIEKTTSWANLIYKVHFYKELKKTVVHLMKPRNM